MKFVKQYLVAAVVSATFFFILFFTLKDYGMHEDSPFHFLRGQAYLQKILTGEPQFNIVNLASPVFFAGGQRISLYKPNASEELLAPQIRVGSIDENSPTQQEVFAQFLKEVGRRKSFYKHNTWTANYWDSINQSHPAVSDILMALTNRMFYGQIGIVSDIEAYHLYVIIVSSLAIFFLFLFCERAFNRRIAFFSAIILALFPFFFAESHFNIKDPVQMSFFTIAIISFYLWFTDPQTKRWFVAFIVSVFLALGTKWNIVFLPLVLIPWIFLVRKEEKIKQFLTRKNIVIFGSIAVVVPFILLIFAWPYLWTSPIQKLFDTFGFYSTLAVRDTRIELRSLFPLPFGLDGSALLAIITMTPPVELILFFLGAVAIFKKKSNLKVNTLILLWLLIPLIRVVWQGSTFYGSIRNFIEYLPAFAVICGIGADFIVEKFAIKGKVLFVGVALFIVILLLPIFRLHPNENVYYNFLVGGIARAKKIGIYSWSSTYHNVYKQGVNWLNRQAEKKAKLAYLDGTMLAISPLWLRSDIRFGSYFSGFDQRGEYIISLVYPIPPAVFAYHYLNDFLNPVFEVKVDGVVLLRVWKNEKKYLKDNYKSEIKLSRQLQVMIYTRGKRKIWEINLGESKRVSRLMLHIDSKNTNCIERNVVWSIDKDRKEQYFVPNKLDLGGGRREFDFPAINTRIIRFWDVQGDSCLYGADLESVYAIQ